MLFYVNIFWKITYLCVQILKQDKMMHNMMEDLEYQQESTNKLMNIVTSLGQQMRGPVMQYKGTFFLIRILIYCAMILIFVKLVSWKLS